MPFVKTATLDELKSGSELLKQSEPIAVRDGGRTIGIFRPLPFPDESIPLEERRKLFAETSDELAAHLDAKGITEEDLQRDFKEFRKRRRGQ